MAVKAPVTSIPKEETPEELIELPEGFETISEPVVKDLPELPTKNIPYHKDHLFFDSWMPKLTENDWNHCLIYCYREYPHCDRQKVNPRNVLNIDTIGKLFTKEEFTKNHGSGRYKLLIIDTNKANRGKGGQIGVARFEIDDPDHPPIINLEELLIDHPSNREYVTKLKALGKLSSDGQPMTNNANDTAGMTALVGKLIDRLTSQSTSSKDTASETMSKMFLDANGAIMGMMKDQVKADDPEKLVKMLAILKDLFPKEGSNNNLELLIKMQSEMAKVQSEAQAGREAMMLKMMEMMNAKKEDDGGEDKYLARLVAYKELFDGLGGGNGGGKKTTLETVMEYGAPVAEKLLGTIGALINFATTRKAAGSPATVTPEQLAQIEQKPPQTNPETMQAPVEQPASNVVEMPKAPTLRELIAGPVGPMIIDALKAGKTGDMFAESVATMFNELTYQQISGLGKEAIINEMQAVPAFYAQVVPSAIEKFVEDFIAYGTDTEVEGGE